MLPLTYLKGRQLQIWTWMFQYFVFPHGPQQKQDGVMESWIIAKLKQKREGFIDPDTAYVSSVLSSLQQSVHRCAQQMNLYCQSGKHTISFWDLVRTAQKQRGLWITVKSKGVPFNLGFGLIFAICTTFRKVYLSKYSMIFKDSYQEWEETSENILEPNLKSSAENASGYIDGLYEISLFSSGKSIGIHSLFLPTPMVW